MEVRGAGGMVVVVTFEVEAQLADLMQDGGLEEFFKQARDKLEEQLAPLRAIEAMRKVTEAVTRNAEETTKK